MVVVVVVVVVGIVIAAAPLGSSRATLLASPSAISTSAGAGGRLRFRRTWW